MKEGSTKTLSDLLKEKNAHLNTNLSTQSNCNKEKELQEKFTMENSLASYDQPSVNENHPPHKTKYHINLNNLTTIGLLGEGSSGNVTLAQDSRTLKKFAIKSIKYQENNKKCIEQEVKSNAELKNVHIIKCYACFYKKHTINLVLEYMDLNTLKALLEKSNKIPEHILGIIIYQLINGLDYLQKQKIIHRDLKPSNILLNSSGYVKISDFGVSAALNCSTDLRHSMIGTIKYMAPERLNTDNYSQNSDIWSLGVIILECCLGEFPYKEVEDIWGLKETITQNPIIPIGDNYSDEIKDFIKSCLTVEPKFRPKASELISHKFIKRFENVDRKELELAEFLKIYSPQHK